MAALGVALLVSRAPDKDVVFAISAASLVISALAASQFKIEIEVVAAKA